MSLNSQEQGMSAPVSQKQDISDGELCEDSQQPARKRHRSRSAQGEVDCQESGIGPLIRGKNVSHQEFSGTGGSRGGVNSQKKNP